jgi:hypothetical protein
MDVNRIVITTTLAIFVTSSAFAQSPYVSASVGADISRFSGVEPGGFGGGIQPGGEAIAWSLRAGTAIGERWGLELGYTRPSEVESESSFNFPQPLYRFGIEPLPPSLTGGAIANTASGFPIALSSLPTFLSSTHLERRDSTIETVAWIRQTAGPIELVYLGGVAFNRTVEEVSVDFGRRLAIIPIPTSTRSTTYGVSPLVGLDGRIGMTDHLRLVVGTRLQSIGGGTTGASGWIVRPSAGLMWEF